MKKKINFLLAFVLLYSLTGCSNNEPDISGTDSKIEEPKTAYSDELSEIISKTEEEVTESQQRYVSLGKILIPLSEKFEREYDAFYFDTYSLLSSTEDKIYCSLVCNELYGDFDDYVEEYTYKDAPKIFESDQRYIVRDFFDYFIERNMETEETVECMGYQFLKQKGTFKVELDDDSIHDVYFVGYYGCMDISSFDDKSVPIMWISFSEVTNEQTKQEMEDIVDDFAANIIFEE